MANYKLFFDGSCGPKNPGGTAAFGYALFKEGQEAPVDHGSGVIGTGQRMTNNLAEFHALYRGLLSFAHYAQSRNDPHANLVVVGDSNLVIQIMNRHWRPKKEKAYFDAYAMADDVLISLRRQGHVLTFDWIPREQNTVCDDLSKAHQKKIAKSA